MNAIEAFRLKKQAQQTAAARFYNSPRAELTFDICTL
jgi:hypothetical protein